MGIRVALGATPARVAVAAMSRPVRHVGLGVLLGIAFTAAITAGVAGRMSMRGVVLVAGYASLMLAVCLTPAIAPLRRALRLDPTDALRREA
jgi:ABC-type antimicrobial peptide transport system permease subunit